MKLTSKILFTAILALLVAFAVGCGNAKKPGKDDGKTAKTEDATGGKKVSLNFHIMSRCPFGVKVLNGITPVLEKMGDRIDFKVDYIGKEKNGKLTSMHGEKEVNGNIIQMCANAHGTFDQWIGFMKCQNEDWRKIPEGWEKCAEAQKIDVKKMKTCYEGEEGKKLLGDSFKRSIEKEAKGSPTIFLEGKKYTGGRSEASFGRALCAKFDDDKPKYCSDLPAVIKVPVTVVADKRCKGRRCQPRGFVSAISRLFEGAEIKELDYSDEEGKKAFDKSGEQNLPMAIFGPTVEKVEDGFKKLRRGNRLKKIDGSDEWVFVLGRWDPTAEICDDKVDNTGNGKIDCDDESCADKKECREEIAKKLNLYIMSQCPFGVKATDAMKEVLENFKKDRKNIDFTVGFIGNKKPDGTLTSLHGEREVKENLHMICAQKHYGDDYKFMDYIYCRNEAWKKNKGREPNGDEWEACATGDIKVDVIKKCSEGDEGKELLTAAYQEAKDLSVTGSPSWLLNNRESMKARSPEGIKTEFCKMNKDVPGCDATLTDTAPGKPVPAGSCGGAPEPPAPKAKVEVKKEEAKPAEPKKEEAKPAEPKKEEAAKAE